MVGLSRQSGQALVSMTSMEHPALALDLTDAMLKTLHPHNPVLAAFVAMIEQLEAKDFGVLAAHKLVRLPLSLIGVDKVRYRTPVVEMLHESILSFNMSDITKQAIQAVLGKHGYCMLFLCSCGVVIGKCADVKNFYGSRDRVAMDRLRSAIDAEGNPVVRIRTLGDIPVATMDVHTDGAEQRLFNRIEHMLETMSLLQSPPQYLWIAEELNAFIEQAQKSHQEDFFDYAPKYATPKVA